MRHPELVGADLDPSFCVWDNVLPRKGHSALGFGQAKPMMMYIMGFWSSESASTPHGEGLSSI